MKAVHLYNYIDNLDSSELSAIHVEKRKHPLGSYMLRMLCLNTDEVVGTEMFENEASCDYHLAELTKRQKRTPVPIDKDTRAWIEVRDLQGGAMIAFLRMENELVFPWDNFILAIQRHFDLWGDVACKDILLPTDMENLAKGRSVRFYFNRYDESGNWYHTSVELSKVWFY